MLTKMIRSHVMLFLLLVVVHSDNITIIVEDTFCGNSSDVSGNYPVQLLMPHGYTPALDNCKFEFINSHQGYKLCFRLTSTLDCHVRIEYWMFESIHKNVTCGQTDIAKEYCSLYKNMSVVIKTEENIFLNNPITLKVYVKKWSYSSFNANAIIGLVFLIFVYIIALIMSRKFKKAYKEYTRNHGRSEVIVAQCVPLQNYPGRTLVPGTHFVPNPQPQTNALRLQPQDNGERDYPQVYVPGNQPQRRLQGFMSQDYTPRPPFHNNENICQPPPYQAENQLAEHTSGNVAEFDPPPSYDEATRHDPQPASVQATAHTTTCNETTDDKKGNPSDC